MRRVIGPLAATGARFICRDGGHLPLAIEGTNEAMPIDHTMQIASAQVKSALLLAGLAARGTTRVIETVPTRDHSENMLRYFGAKIAVTQAGAGRVIELQGQPVLRGADLAVPGDPSSAAFPLVAALLVPGSRVTVRGVGLNPLRTGLFETLREMGAALQIDGLHNQAGEPVGDITAIGTELRAVDVPPHRAPSMIDEYPILAVACAAAHGTSRLRGLAELRVKESDRLAATAAMLQAAGVRVAVEGDDLVIEGQGHPPGGGTVETHMDHRIAMAALVLGTAAAQPVRVDDTGFIDTSFPGFAALMTRIFCRFA